LSTRFHSVAGRVVIVDDDTLRIEDFHYDGGGPAVYLYLGRANTNAAFRQGVALGPLLSGPVYRGDDLVIDVPADISLSDYTAISVWCAAFNISFGSGTFGAEVQYEVTFDATWSESTHAAFPPDPHFSGLIGGTHRQRASFWQVDELATAGIEDMAETGGKSQLQREINSAIKNGSAYSVISGGGVNPAPGVVRTTFSINTSHPRVTLVSMIAPSPDWFVGVEDLLLFQGGRWRAEVRVDLHPYDAGTDSGDDFTSEDVDTQPQELIQGLRGVPFPDEPPLGTFTFRLVCEDPPLGDLNGDCRVDALDLAILSENWLVDRSLQLENRAGE
jgi:hypothetical protein